LKLGPLKSICLEELLSTDDENISPILELPVDEAPATFSTEPQAFSPDRMVRCDECLRANPPTRVECLYCGRALPMNEAIATLARPKLRPLEKWEQGFNTILIKAPEVGLSEEGMLQAAALLHLDAGDLKQIILAPRPLPLVRTAAQAEAVIIEQSLSALGLQTRVVSDQEMAPAIFQPRRLRSLDLGENDFAAFQTSGSDATRIEWSAITMIVTGRVFARQVEFKERKRRGTVEKEIIAASETARDESILDIYTKNPDGSWRIVANNFDFSCLGNRKSLLAGENFSILVRLIRDEAPEAVFDDAYNSLRRVLELVWPSEQQTESRGWQRGRGGYSTSEVTLTNNEPQFTRYSRLSHFLKVVSAGLH
jgi:hypothetical protein